MNNTHIILYEKFIDPDHELYLSPNEFMIYSCLYLFRRFYKQIATVTIDLLHQELPKFKSRRETDNKMYIKSVLFTLRNKGLIDFDVDDPKYSTRINITFNKMDNTTYDYIPADIYEKTDDAKEFMVLCVVEARCLRDKKRGCVMSFSDWAKILGCSSQTAVNVINRLLAKGLIWKKTGKFDGSRQEINAYFNYDIGVNEASVSIQQRSTDKSKGKPNEAQKMNHYIENPDSSLVEMGKNWFIDMSNLEDKDFEAYKRIEMKKTEDRTPGEQALFEVATNRLERIGRTPGGRKMIENKMEKAKREIEKEREMKNNKAVSDDHDDYMRKLSMWTYFYQRKGGDVQEEKVDLDELFGGDYEDEFWNELH